MKARLTPFNECLTAARFSCGSANSYPWQEHFATKLPEVPSLLLDPSCVDSVSTMHRIGASVEGPGSTRTGRQKLKRIMRRNPKRPKMPQSPRQHAKPPKLRRSRNRQIRALVPLAKLAEPVCHRLPSLGWSQHRGLSPHRRGKRRQMKDN